MTACSAIVRRAVAPRLLAGGIRRRAAAAAAGCSGSSSSVVGSIVEGGASPTPTSSPAISNGTQRWAHGSSRPTAAGLPGRSPDGGDCLVPGVPSFRPTGCAWRGSCRSRISAPPRWFSSASVGSGNESGGDGGDGDGGEDGTASWTTPLSEVSDSDLNLATGAAADSDSQAAASSSPTAFPVPGGGGGKDLHLSDIPGAQTGGKKLAIVFTCKVCSTRSAKKFTEQAYRNGVVMVRCPGCENLHLIADRLGFFGDKGDGGWDVQKALAEMGENVNAVSDDNVLELTMADVLGSDKVEELARGAGAGAGGAVQATAGRGGTDEKVNPERAGEEEEEADRR